MSSYVCPICLSLLTEPVDIAPGRTKDDYRMVATKCGHMFHRECLIVWLEFKIQRGLPETCPSCNDPTEESDIVMLFPQSDEGFLDYSDLVNKAKKSEQEATNLKRKLQTATVEKRFFKLLLYFRENRIIKLCCKMFGFQDQIKNLQDEIYFMDAEIKKKSDEYETLKMAFEEYKSALEGNAKVEEGPGASPTASHRTVKSPEPNNGDNKRMNATNEKSPLQLTLKSLYRGHDGQCYTKYHNVVIHKV